MKLSDIILFCIPFAGGSSYSYRELTQYLSPYLKVMPLELPGRGKRLSEPLQLDMQGLAEDIYQQVSPFINQPYAFYGHSMGAWIGYLAIKKILQAGQALPLHLFVSGRCGPAKKNQVRQRYLMPKSEFIKLLSSFEGTPPEVLADKEMLEFFEPILRADIQAIDNYMYHEDEPLTVPITVMIGMEDSTISREGALEWQRETIHSIKLKQFIGGHFFIFPQAPTVSRIIVQTLETASRERASIAGGT